MTKRIKPVGYGSPPIHSQWEKGQSGNPKGRRKGQRNLKTDLAEELDKTITITENNVTRVVTKQRALVMKLVNGAIQGDPKLSLSLLRMLVASLPDPEQKGGALSADDADIVAEFLAAHGLPAEAGK